MGKYFGTDGFRGEANVNLTAKHAYEIGRFLGWYYGRNQAEGENARFHKDRYRQRHAPIKLYV